MAGLGPSVTAPQSLSACHDQLLLPKLPPFSSLAFPTFLLGPCPHHITSQILLPGSQLRSTIDHGEYCQSSTSGTQGVRSSAPAPKMKKANPRLAENFSIIHSGHQRSPCPLRNGGGSQPALPLPKEVTCRHSGNQRHRNIFESRCKNMKSGRGPLCSQQQSAVCSQGSIFFQEISAESIECMFQRELY